MKKTHSLDWVQFTGWMRTAAAGFITCVVVGLAACAPAYSSAAPQVQVDEYPLVEQSTDNPNHPGFEQRAAQAVAAAGGGMLRGGLTGRPNRALASYGYRLDANPSPPFSAFALYSGDTLVRRDIARFWSASDDSETLLVFETISGERLALTPQGVMPWAFRAVGTADGAPGEAVLPARAGDSLASPTADPGDRLAFYSGGPQGSIPATGGADEPILPNLRTWNDPAGGEHWGVELREDGRTRLLLDGEDINARHEAADAFGLLVLDGRPLYFYTAQGRVHLNYAGADLPVTFDQVLHDLPPETAIYNPASGGSLAWFYALRDGLWYYVEVGAPD